MRLSVCLRLSLLKESLMSLTCSSPALSRFETSESCCKESSLLLLYSFNTFVFAGIECPAIQPAHYTIFLALLPLSSAVIFIDWNSPSFIVLASCFVFVWFNFVLAIFLRLSASSSKPLHHQLNYNFDEQMKRANNSHSFMCILIKAMCFVRLFCPFALTIGGLFVGPSTRHILWK